MCKKLKLPEKVLRALILIIMVGLVQCTNGSGPLRCFDPVWRTYVFNDDRVPNGYVYVNKAKQISTTLSKDSTTKYLYKISTEYKVKLRHSNETGVGYAFYLYDPREKRFLCFKNTGGAMTTMTFNAIERKKAWNKCKFTDRILEEGISEPSQAYVTLELAGHRDTIMQFDKKGRIMPRKRVENCIHRNRRASRHRDRCTPKIKFMLYYNNYRENCCSDAFSALCKGPTRNMTELQNKCEEVSNSRCGRNYG